MPSSGKAARVGETFLCDEKRGFPKIRGTVLGVPIIRTIVFWGLYWGPFILGNYQDGCT